MSESGQEDGAWTFQAAREVTTDGATCGLHGYQNCGVCAARAARWLLRQHAAKDAELANRHAEIERLRGFVAELRRDSLHTDLVATLAEKNAELAHLTAEVEALRAEHEAVGDYLTRRGCLEVTSDQTMEQAISRQRNSRDAMEQAHAAVEARKEPT